MEERIIDDEYGRGVRLRKTKNGYVDVTDEQLAEEADETAYEDGEGEEIEFEFPVFAEDKDDEELATLTPEEAQELIRRREEEQKRRFAEYERTCAEGEELLQTDSVKAAELKFERAMQLDDVATRATVGYWRAKTANFTQPDALLEDYLDESISDLEHDLGIEAVQILVKEHQQIFETRIAQLDAEITPLRESVEDKQAKREVILKERLKRSSVITAICAIPTIVFLVLTIVFGVKNFTTRGNEYVAWTIAFAVLFFVTLVIEAIQANKTINDGRMYRLNKRLNATEEGKHLQSLMVHKSLYEQLLFHAPAKLDKE